MEVIIANHEDVEFTINSVLLTVPSDRLERVTVAGGDSAPAHVRHVAGDTYQAFNAAASTSTSEHLVFVPGLTRFKDSWAAEVLQDLVDDDRRAVTTVTSTLEPGLRQAEPIVIGTHYFDWDLELHPSHTPTVVADGPLAVHADRFAQLGGFDTGLDTGHYLEYCLKSWLCGGSVKVSDGHAACIRSPTVVDDRSAARIAKVWFDGSLDRFTRNVPESMEIGKWDAQLAVKEKFQTRSVRWLIDTHVPALGRIFDLRGRYRGKTAAVLCDGPSLDQVSRWEVAGHGLIIGLDYVPAVFQCDYAVSVHRDPVRSLVATGKYRPQQLLVSEALRSPDGLGLVPAQDVLAGATVFGMLEYGAVPSRLDPPVVNVGHSLPCAVQLAAFLGATRIVLYGWDGKLVRGASHTSLVPHYNSGRYLPDNKQTKDMYDYVNSNLETLARVLAGYGVRVLRYNYV